MPLLLATAQRFFAARESRFLPAADNRRCPGVAARSGGFFAAGFCKLVIAFATAFLAVSSSSCTPVAAEVYRSITAASNPSIRRSLLWAFLVFIVLYLFSTFPFISELQP